MCKYLAFIYFSVLLSNLSVHGSQHQFSIPKFQRVEQLLASQKQAVAQIDASILQYLLIMPVIAANMSGQMNDSRKFWQSVESQARSGIDLLYYKELKELLMDRYSQEILCEITTLDRMLE